MITYKAFDKNLSCQGFQYLIGKKYKMAGKIEMCQNGFHSCVDLLSTSRFYKLDPDQSRWAEVEIDDKALYNKEDGKYCSKTIRIVREIFWGEVLREFDKQSVGGYLDLQDTQIKSLGSLQSVGGSLDLRGTQIKSLGSLQSVGGYLYLRGTQINKSDIPGKLLSKCIFTE